MDLRQEIADFISTSSALRGSLDDPAGTWAESHGPKILPFPDGQLLETTSIYIGDENSSFTEDYIQSGQVGYRQDRSFELILTVGAHPFVKTMELARAQILAIYTLFKTNPTMGAARNQVTVMTSIDGPNPFPTEIGVCCVTSMGLEITDFL